MGPTPNTHPFFDSLISIDEPGFVGMIKRNGGNSIYDS